MLGTLLLRLRVCCGPQGFRDVARQLLRYGADRETSLREGNWRALHLAAKVAVLASHLMSVHNI